MTAPFFGFLDLFSLVSLTILFFLVFVYLISKFFPSSKLSAYVRDNFSSFISSQFIILFILFFYSGAKISSNLFVGGNAIEKSQTYINSIVSRIILPEYVWLASYSFMLRSMDSFKFSLAPSVWGMTTKLFPAWDFDLNAIGTLIGALNAFYATLSIQSLGFSLIDNFMPIVMVLGFIFYLFPFSGFKTAGSFMISFGLGFYIVFPFFYCIGFMAFEEYLKEVGEEMYYNALTSKSSVLFSSPGIPSNSFIFNVLKTNLVCLFNFGKNLWSFIFIAFAELIMLYPIITSFSYISLMCLFIPTLAMLITTTFITSLMRFLLWSG